MERTPVFSVITIARLVAEIIGWLEIALWVAWLAAWLIRRTWLALMAREVYGGIRRR